VAVAGEMADGDAAAWGVLFGAAEMLLPADLRPPPSASVSVAAAVVAGVAPTVSAVCARVDVS